MTDDDALDQQFADLKALGMRLNEIREDVNTRIRDLESRLNELNLGVRAQIGLGNSGGVLSWERRGDRAWGLHYQALEAKAPTPLLSCSQAVRMEALDSVADLLRQLHTNADALLTRLREASGGPDVGAGMQP